MYPLLFCPNPHCTNHSPPKNTRWFIKAGSYSTSSGRPLQRYRCTACRMRFSRRTFHIDYYTHRHLDYQLIFQMLRSGAGIRDIARTLAVSPNTIQNRIGRLARQMMAVHASLTAELSPCENIAADGFLSFTGSQYFPTEITHLVGCESQFVYFFNAANLRRRGTMTEAQKRRRRELEQTFRPPSGELAGQFNSLSARLLQISARSSQSPLSVVTDEHTVYARHFTNDPAMKERVTRGELTHIRISSHKARTLTNPLFPVNYIDRELRMMSSDHVRETNKFARNLNNMMERLWIRIFDLNFVKPHRINRGETSEKVSAEVAGLERALLVTEIKTLFWRRRFLTKSNFNPWIDYRTWLRGWVTPMRKSLFEALPRFALQ